MSVAAPDADDLRQFAVRLAAIAELLDRRSEQAVRRIEHGAADLGRASHALGGSSDRLVRELVDMLRQQSGAAVQKGVGEALAQCRAAFDAAEAQATRAASEWRQQRVRLATGQRRLLWGSAAALIVGSVLAAGGSAWLVREHMRQLEQAHFGEDMLEATRTGAITRCGQRLCARVGANPHRYGAHGEYVVVTP